MTLCQAFAAYRGTQTLVGHYAVTDGIPLNIHLRLRLRPRPRLRPSALRTRCLPGTLSKTGCGSGDEYNEHSRQNDISNVP
jgi:hypothetical protein